MKAFNLNSIGGTFNEASDVLEDAGNGVRYVVDSAEFDASGTALDVTAFAGDSKKDAFIKMYPLGVAKTLVVPASQCTLGNLLIKVGALTANKSKIANPFKGLDQSGILSALSSVNPHDVFVWNAFGNQTSVSALYKLNMLNWHWANGNSEFWDFGPKLQKHADAVTLLYEYKKTNNSYGMWKFYNLFAAELLKGCGYPAPTDLQIQGVAGAFYAESRGDISLFNSMTDQNLAFIGATTQYAYGLQQRLNCRLLGYHVWASKYLMSQGHDIFKVPAAILSSPTLSRLYEAENVKNDDYMKKQIASYMSQTSKGNLTSIALNNGTTFSATGYNSYSYAVGLALNRFQGIAPDTKLSPSFGENWNAKAKYAMYNNLNK